MDLLQIRYILILLVYAKQCDCSISPTQKTGGAVYYQPSTEYVFLLETKTDFETARLEGLVKVGLIHVSDLANDTGQELLLNIHTMDLTSGGHKALIHNEQDLTKWFSVKMRQHGVIFEVVYPHGEDLEIVNIKKNIAGMFSGHLEFKGHQEVDGVWEYHTRDIGTEGHHRSSYTATVSNEKTIFRKKRLTQPIEHGNSLHEKEIHFHPHLGISDKIKINERYDAPNKLAPGFDAYAGLPVAQSEDTKINNKKDFPAMSATSESEITFLYSRETFPPVHPSIQLVKDSLRIKSIPLDMSRYNKTDMWSFIRGNLTCMRKDMEKVTVSVNGTYCFQKLVYLLLHIPKDNVDEIISSFFPGKNTKRVRDTIDRLSMLDSLMATNSEYIQDALTKAVFLAASPDKHMLERFLMLSIANNKTMSKLFVTVLQTFAFQPEMFPESIQDPALTRTAVMALGAIASRLSTFNRYDEATKIVTRMEDTLGINDPWEYNRHLRSISPSKHDEHHFNTAAMIEALGNAGFARSFEHIVSFTNSSDIPSILRRSGLHSLRNFATKEVADILMSASEADDDKQVRKFADHLYQAHPHGKKIEEYYHSNENNSMKAHNTSAITANDRHRRSTLNKLLDEYLTWEFPYNSDAVLWKGGNDKLGTSIGYRLRSNFKLKVRLLNGILEIDGLNNAYVRLHVGILGFNVDVASADQCFDGALEIRINPMKEIKCAVVEQFLNAFDRVIQYYLGKLADAIKDFKDWILRPEGLPQILEDFGETLASIPQKAHNALHKINDALLRISRISHGILSPVIKPVSDLVLRTAQFVQDFQKDLMKFYNAISDAIVVILHSASEQLIRAIQVISDNTRLAEIVTSPHTAIENIYKALVNSGIATDAILQVKQILEKAGILGEGPSPHWRRTSENIASLQDEVTRMKNRVNKQFLNLFGGNRRRKRGTQSERIDNEAIQNEVIDVLDDVWVALDPLKHITDPIHEVADRFFDSSKVLKRLYQNLRNSYLDTKSEIVKILGPNVHPDFPREIRLDGNGCQSNGFYPSTADGFYSDQGVDLVTNAGQMIVSPYSGSVSITKYDTKRIRLVPSDGGFINTVIYIDNIEPSNTIPVDGFVNVIAGTPLGIPSKNGPCGSRHIHFVVKTEFDTKPYDLPRDQRSTAGKSGIHDSSMYLNDRVLGIRAYKRGCDDFTVKILGMSLIKGRLTQDFHEKDTSPKHTVDLTWLFGRRKRNAVNQVTPYSSPAWFDSASVTNIVKDLGLPIPDFGNPYPVGFNFNNLKMGPVLNFFKRLVGNDIADRLTDGLRSLVILVTDIPCVNPTRLTKGQLARELYKRGESINGTREDLIRQYLNSDNRCPLLQIALPANTYCHVDPTCLAVECCINVPFLFQQISLKAFARYNPCDSTLVLGIHPWSISLHIPDPDFAVQQENAFNIDLKDLGQQRVKLSYSLEKSEELFIVSCSFSICDFDGQCSVYYDVFKQLAFMVPMCDVDKNLSWREVDILEYLQRIDVSTLLEYRGYESSQRMEDQIAKALGISPNIISNLPKCHSPETLSRRELQHALQTYGESSWGRTEDLLNRLSLAMNSCKNIRISELLSSTVSKRINCFMSPDCAKIECCLRVYVLGYTPSFRVFMEMQSCNRLLVVGFENAVSIIHLEDVTQNGISDEAIFGWVKLRYAVRMTAVDEYSVRFSVALCPSNSECTETTVVENWKFIIYPCNGSMNDDKISRPLLRQKRQMPEDSGELHSEGYNRGNRLDDSIEFWRERLSNGNTAFTSEENMSTKVSGIPKEGESMIGKVPEAVPLASLLEKHQQEHTPLDAENIFNLPMNDQSVWQGINNVGGELTETGMAILTNYILESDLSTIQSLIDAQELHRMKSVIDTSLALLEDLNNINLAEIIKQLQQVLRELIEINIDDILYLNLPPEFQSRDFVINAVARIPESGRISITVMEKVFPFPLGIVILEFYVGIRAEISIEIPFSLTVGTMTYQVGITPGVVMVGWAGLGVRIFVFRLSFEFEIELLGQEIPISRETNYCKFPIEVTDRVDLILTPLVLRLYIKIQIRVNLLFTSFTKTLYQRELWKWSSPSIRFNLKKKVTYKYDKTIPDLFDSLVDSIIPDDGKRKRSIQTLAYPESSKSCVVEQIPGLDYTEPAFIIEVAASDDVSYVTYTLSVGTEPGGNEVINNEVFGGPSAVVTKPLKSGVPLYFSLRARNSAGGTATAMCQLPTYDTTKPGGRVNAVFISTSHPNVLKASAVLHEDSEIAERRASVGYGSGIWGDQVVPWKLIDSVQREVTGSNKKDEFDHFTNPRRGRLGSVPVATYTYLNPNFCARDCLALPASKCLSFNYDFGPDNTCELLQEIEGHGVELHQSGLFSHFERLGVGHAIEIDHNNLQLGHNNLYFFNIHTKNILGYESVISSKGILTDFTIPNPGLIKNAQSDIVIWQECTAFVPEEWQQRCTVTTTFPNHRIIEDGQGSHTVFNGHVDFVDVLYTRANKFISANWDGFYDNETGIYGYTWSVGSGVCMDDVSSHIDPHSHLFDESEWIHEGIVTGVYLEDGHYFITVRALNKVEFGGPMAVSVCHTTPYVIDTTPPIIYSIHNVTYDSEEYLIGVNVNSTDKESGIARHDFALGRTPRDIDMLPWQRKTNSEVIGMQFRIPDGIPAWVKIRAVNNVNLSISSHSDTSLFVDMTPPIQGIVTDGIEGYDLEYFKDISMICTSWKDFNDPDSGISSYLWYVGTYPGGSDVVYDSIVQHDAHYACSDAVSMQHNTTYFSTVLAFNGGINKLNVSVVSNGVTLDVTPPVAGYVFDGTKDDGTDLVYSSKSASVSALWGNFTDPESGVVRYEISVHRKPSENGNQKDDILHSPESVGKLSRSIEWHHFHLHHNDFVYVTLRTVNGAENSIDTNSNGYRIDLTPPVLLTIGDGRLLNFDTEFQKNTHQIATNWIYADGESDILYYQLAIYELKQGTKTKVYPSDVEKNSFKTIWDGTATVNIQDNLRLEPGAIYTTLVKAINGAKLVSSHETTGIRIDPSPPKMIFARAGSIDGDHEEILNGYVYQSDRLGIKASWRAVDHESRIKSYWVAVGTEPHTSDVKDFQSFGADRSGYIAGLELSLSNECQQNCHPVYYVCVKAENGAGEFSNDACSSPIKVVPADKTGYVTDGPAEVILEGNEPSIADIDVQHNTNTITISFAGFESKVNGIRHYEWAIGTTPEGEDVQPYMSDGIVLSMDKNAVGLPGSGKAQALIDLEHETTYYATVRAITGSGDILESSSDGVTVDQTLPDITLLEIGLHEFTNESKQLMGPVYQSDISPLTAMWSVEDSESDIETVFYSVGTYLGGNDVKNTTVAEVNYIPFGAVRPNILGKPNKLQIEGINTAGLRRSITFPSLVIDTSPPNTGQVWCPTILHTRGHLKCSWAGFSDEEGPITRFKFLIGSKENENDQYVSPDIPAHRDYFEIKVNGLNLRHNFKYYVTIEAINSVGMKSSASSQPVLIDDTPPVAGTVVEVLSDTFINLNVAEDRSSASDVNINDHDAVCIDSLWHLSALWEPFHDPETQIVKYEVAVGHSPFETQVKRFVEVPAEQTKLWISNIDLSRQNKIFVTVRGYNEAGLFTSATSNGAYICRLALGLVPLYPLRVTDGRGQEDRHFQASLVELGATWDFSGYPCPFKRYEWAIRRIDGKEVQPFTDVGEHDFGTNSELDMADGETYYVIVRGTNILGLTATARSDGVTIRRDPLIPGHVFDGPFYGTDIMYQQSTHVLHASWIGFGQRDEIASAYHTGNDGILQSETTEQTVDYYEVAVGTDRSSAKTRDNVVPFTNLGRNTSCVFENLSLQALSAVYYVTVRAHSVSFSSTEVSSNGITTGVDSEVEAGKIDIPKFLNSLDTVDVQWSEFQSSLDIKFYYIGITEILNERFPQIECNLLEDDQSLFSVFPLRSTNLDTYMKATELNLKQLGTYAVFIFGTDEAGECNSTSATFTVDTSPPVTGKMKTGPFYDMPLDYTTVKEELQVWWHGFEDPESGIAFSCTRLFSASSCTDIELNDVVVDWIELKGNFTEYRFVDITLLENKAYFVELEVTNNAGGSTSLRSAPIIFDESVPVAGKVVDGSDYQQDARYHGDTTSISGSFLHLANPNGTPCSLELAHFDDTQSWAKINIAGLRNMDGVLWDIVHLPEQVSVFEDELEITLERDVRKPRVLSGGYATSAHLLRGGLYEIDILAASGDINAITSIVFWDGSANTVGGFQEPGRDVCACCYEPSENNTCLCDCNAVLNNPSSSQNQTKSPGSLKTSSWEVDSGLDQEALINIKTACGLQLIPAENNSRAVLWCRFENDRYYPMSISQDLLYDPSQEWHKYGLLFTSTTTDVNQMQWKLDLSIDGVWICELDGIPEMSDSAKLVLHVWNKGNHVPILQDVFHPPASTARFRKLRLPPAPSNLCRYGDPFRGGSSPLVEYKAGVGSESGKDDIISFRTLDKPCIPCDGICSYLHCDNKCQVNALVPYVFTLSNISLPESRLTDNITAPVFLTVESTLGNGHSVIASSNGITIDTSPPILDYMFYIDDAQGDFQPVTYQSSNTTIKAYWNFIDEESEIADNLWAIGSFPGSTDLQNFASVGFEQIGTNSSLEGLLFHNHTYYVTLRGINGAGKAKTIHCPGVIVLINSPLPDGVNTTVLFSEELPEDTYPPNSLKTTDSNHVGVEWSKADDDTVTRYEYCVGSSSDTQDDIIECIPVAINSSGSVTISDGGEVHIDSEMGEAKLNITEFPLLGDFNNTDVIRSRRSSAHLNLEPGKTLFNTIRVCNAAELCSPVHSSETTIIPEIDSLVQSSEGEDITVTSEDSGDGNDVSGLRQKRSLGSTDYTLNIQTTGGLHRGGSIVFGYLDEKRLRQVYESEAVTSYRSYIVNPGKTLLKTSRFLRKRILHIYEPSFYLTSLGQVELNGPLQVNVTMPLGMMNVSETYPSLLFWNPDKQEWQEAKNTCKLDKSIMFDLELSRFSVQVCNTRSTKTHNSRKRRVAQEPEVARQFFQRETQFVVAEVSNTTVNEPPVLLNLVGAITIKEDQGTIRYKLQATDPDGDAVQFSLDTQQPEMKNGNVSVTPDGLFSYTPCLDCYGEEIVTIVAEEVPYSEKIRPLSKTFSLRVVILQEEDEPVLFVAKDGEVVGSSREVFMTTEEKLLVNNNYQPLLFVIGAYDVDNDENIDIEIRDISNGNLDMIEQSSNKLKESVECHHNLSKKNKLTHVPCGLDIHKGPSKLTWLMRYYSYTPFMNVSGVDKLEVIARDKHGLISRHLTLNIGILRNPCIHGKCKGPVDDIACVHFERSFSFNSYTCECDTGYKGDNCQIKLVTDDPGFVPESTNVPLSIIIIISFVIPMAGTVYYKKRRKGFYAFDKGITTGGDNDNIEMDVFAVKGSSDQAERVPEIAEKRIDNILENTEDNKETLYTIQKPLDDRKNSATQVSKVD